jgi:hypothetical protein
LAPSAVLGFLFHPHPLHRIARYSSGCLSATVFHSYAFFFLSDFGARPEGLPSVIDVGGGLFIPVLGFFFSGCSAFFLTE